MRMIIIITTTIFIVKADNNNKLTRKIMLIFISYIEQMKQRASIHTVACLFAEVSLKETSVTLICYWRINRWMCLSDAGSYEVKR
jgi:hypothetical protein